MRLDRSLRILGLIAGLAVAALFVAVAIVVQAVGGPIGSPVALPTLAAGALGGWLVAPAAVIAHDRRGWIALVVGFGLLADAIGAVVTAFGLAVASAASPLTTTGAPDLGQALVGVIFGTVEATLLGLIVFGWLALPFTVGAAAIWATTMRGLAKQLGGGTRWA